MALDAERRGGDVEGADDRAAGVAHGCGGRDETALELVAREDHPALAAVRDPRVERGDVLGRVARAARELDVGEEQLERRRVVVEEQGLARGGAVRRGDAPDPADRLDGAAGRLGQQRQDVGALQDGEVRALLRLDGEAPQPRARLLEQARLARELRRARRSASRAGR